MKFILKLICIAVLVTSCTKDDDSVVRTPKDTQETPESESLVAKAIDTRLFKQINAVDEVLITGEIWPTYTLKNVPMYLIHKNEDGHPDRAYIVNPKSAVMGAIAVPEIENGGIDVVQYNAQAQAVFDIINTPDEFGNSNGLYQFDYKIGNEDGYYVQIYSDEEVLAGENPSTLPGGFFNFKDYVFPSIDFIIHEPYHVYQENWTFMGAPADVLISKEVLELRVLLHQIFKDYPNNTDDKKLVENKLKQFVAIRSTENKILGSDSASFGEKYEGTPRYVEKLALRAAFPNRANEPFIIGSILDDDYGIKDQDLLAMVIVNLEYEIGASTYYSMKVLNIEAQAAIESGKTQFDIAKDYFKMTDSEIEKQLQNAKNTVDFAKIETTVNKWLKL